MRLLLEELGGHPSLARLRGRLGGSAISMVAALAEEGRPTQAKLSARDLGSDLAWAARLLAKLKRDGREVAASELENVLTWPNYMMLGEQVRVERTVPVTAFMYLPLLMMALTRWLNSWDWGKDPLRAAGLGSPGHNADLRQVLVALQGVGDYFAAHPLQSYDPMVDGILRGFVTPVVTSMITSLPPPDGDWSLALGGLRFAEGGRCKLADALGLVFECMHVLYYPQNVVLSGIPREEQADAATWQFHLPAGIAQHRFGIGLHPESEHELWHSRADLARGRRFG